MDKNKIEHLIDILIHQNLYVVDKGSKEKSDYVVGGTEDLKRELLKLFEFSQKSNDTK